jgi:hypothetical protein
MENQLKVIDGPFCKTISTQYWGELKAMKVEFSKSVTDF